MKAFYVTFKGETSEDKKEIVAISGSYSWVMKHFADSVPDWTKEITIKVGHHDKVLLLEV
jgi:hypothetical protein